MQARIDEAIAGRERAKKLRGLDKFAAEGMGSNKGYSETIPGPIPTAARAAAGATGEAAEILPAAGKAAGALGGLATGTRKSPAPPRSSYRSSSAWPRRSWAQSRRSSILATPKSNPTAK